MCECHLEVSNSANVIVQWENTRKTFRRQEEEQMFCARGIGTNGIN